MRTPAAVERGASEGSYRDLESMGSILSRALGPALRSIAIVAYDGSNGVPGQPPHPIGPAPDGSLEAALHRSVAGGSAWVDLRGCTSSFVARPLGYVPMRARWGEVFDAMWFIDAMTPSHSIASP